MLEEDQILSHKMPMSSQKKKQEQKPEPESDSDEYESTDSEEEKRFQESIRKPVNRRDIFAESSSEEEFGEELHLD